MSETATAGLRDPLTGAATRALLREHLAVACARARSAEARVALLWCGLDDFHLVNRSLGYTAGDEVLRIRAARLDDLAPGGAVVARPGGDELALLLPDLGADAEQVAELTAQQVAVALAAPCHAGGRELRLRTSIGVSLMPDDAGDEDALLRHAEAAMHEAKQEGGGSYTFYAGATREALERLMLTSRLHRAIDERQLLLHFQPIVRLPDREVAGAEALLRWDDPGRGLVEPLAFLAAAEHTGLIHPIGHYVLNAACAQARAWRDAGKAHWMTVNVSLRQLQEPGFAGAVEQALATAGLPAETLVLEVTETNAMADPRCVDPALERLRALGVRIAVDDFGTGYSSFVRLQQLEVAMVKVDRSLLRGVPSDPSARCLATATLGMLASLGLDVVAEGVEQEEQLEFLVERGCRYAQGFHLGRPQRA